MVAVVAKRPAVIRKRLLLLIVPALLAVWVLVQIDLEENNIHLFEPHFQQSDVAGTVGFLVNTPGCRIPAMDPFDPSVEEFIYSEDPVVCRPEDLPPIVESNLTHIILNEESLGLHNLTNITCCYQPFWRVQVDTSESVDGRIPYDVDSRAQFHNVCIEFEKSAYMGDNEFVKVACYSEGGGLEHVDFHSFTPLKRSVELEKSAKGGEERVSVLIVGVDAVSRLNLMRQMPETVAYLKEELGAVEMMGYNKVEDNTFPNLVPVLSGLTEKELVDVCWPTARSVFDSCPFLWNKFSAAGYRTCFAEDSSWMGIFNYLKYSFRKQPTDYYWRIFNKKAEDEIGSDHRLNAKLCIGGRMSIEVLLSYAEKFALTMSDRPSFSLIWGSSLSHDFLNLPKFGDAIHRNFLERLRDRKVLNRTALVFMSDHGIRWGGIRNTYQGHLEERLPFLYFVFPRWFSRKYTTAVGTLHRNSRRLTSPFDLHETLNDLLDAEGNLNNEALKSRTELLRSGGPAAKPRGVSLFLPVSPERTCQDAGIADHWCTCHQTAPVALNDSLVVEASNHLVSHLNALVEPFEKCAKLQLNRILSARLEQTLPQIESTDSGLQDYIVTIETAPGAATFEATVRRSTGGKWKVMGTVSRTNTYGHKSDCISSYRLRLYCFCKA